MTSGVITSKVVTGDTSKIARTVTNVVESSYF